MKPVISIAAWCALLCIALSSTRALADDATTPTVLKGTACCAKCYLHQTPECQAALKVHEDGKDVIYYVTMDDKGKGLHEKVCTQPMDNVTITGIVSEKDGQKWITASSIDLSPPSTAP
jgi:hypothetical protein